MIYVVTALIVVTVAQGWLLWRLVRTLGVLRGFDERLTRTAQGLALLVDTAEAGFAMLGVELEKVAASAPAKAAPRTTTRRVVNAARHGRSVAEIAAREGVSEGEVQLRMHLAGNGIDTRARVARASRGGCDAGRA